jgi:hypothetical protein
MSAAPCPARGVGTSPLVCKRVVQQSQSRSACEKWWRRGSIAIGLKVAPWLRLRLHPLQARGCRNRVILHLSTPTRPQALSIHPVTMNTTLPWIMAYPRLHCSYPQVPVQHQKTIRYPLIDHHLKYLRRHEKHLSSFTSHQCLSAW